jgi:hypothetical protein
MSAFPVATTESTEPSLTFICEICGFFITSLNSLKVHLKQHNIDQLDNNNNNLNNGKLNEIRRDPTESATFTGVNVNSNEDVVSAQNIKTEVDNDKNLNESFTNKDKATSN